MNYTTARTNLVQQLVDGAPSTITPSKLRQLLIDIADSLAVKSSPFSKVDATTNPTVDDDGVNSSGNGSFETGSKWYNQVTDEVFLCLINTTGAATWVPITLSIDELGSAAVLNVGTGANEVVQLDAQSKLPAVDGSQLTNIGVVTQSQLDTLSNSLGALASLDEVPDDAITTDKLDNSIVEDISGAVRYDEPQVIIDGGTQVRANIGLDLGRLHLQHQTASGTGGGTFSSGAWRTRTLNTEVDNNIIGASWLANQITLPAGKYDIEAQLAVHRVGSHRARLYNVTAGAEVIMGNHNYSNINDGGGNAELMGEFTLTETTVLEIQHRCNNSHSNNGFGHYGGWGVPEVHVNVIIREVV